MGESRLGAHFFWLLVILILGVAGWLYHRGVVFSIRQGEIVKEEPGPTIKQVFDDRSFGGLENRVWIEIGGSPFGNFKQVDYKVGDEEIDLVSGRVYEDRTTGVVWSAPSNRPMDNRFIVTESGRVAGRGVLEFCNRLNDMKYAGLERWEAPTQKQLMQAYIDGAGVYMKDNPSYIWSVTEFSGDTLRAWRVNLQAGDVSSALKVNGGAYAMCVVEREI